MNLDREFRRAVRAGLRGVDQRPRTPTSKASRRTPSPPPPAPLTDPMLYLGHAPRPRKRSR